MNKIRFNEIIKKYETIEDIESIGTLQEKTMHKVVKNYLEPCIENQEIKINNYYVDIFKNGEIIEVQTRQFNKLRTKLNNLLKEYNVTVCYPIPHEKNIYWLEPESLVVKDIRKSPKKGSVYEILFELYKIKQLLNNPNLKFKILLIDIKEYKLLNGWNESRKKGSTRYNQIPERLIEEVDIINLKDYLKLIPKELPTPFTSKDYQKLTKLTLKKAQIALNVLRSLDIIKLVGKDSRLNLYTINQF